MEHGVVRLMEKRIPCGIEKSCFLRTLRQATFRESSIGVDGTSRLTGHFLSVFTFTGRMRMFLKFVSARILTGSILVGTEDSTEMPISCIGGMEQPLEIQSDDRCPVCDGDGKTWDETGTYVTCVCCSGTGIDRKV